MFDAEGQISIPLEEFWEFVNKYHSLDHCEMALGVPRVVDGDLVIDYAASTECDPRQWAVKPKAVTQWEELKKVNKG